MNLSHFYTDGVVPCWTRRLRAVALLVVLLAAAAPRAEAGFIGAYDFGLFTLTNTFADGFAALSPDGSLVLTGGNDGSSIPGITDFSIIAPATGTVSFNFSYSSLDLPAYDFAGFFVSTFTKLADSDGESGTASFVATAGERFGFRVSTLDNTGEPGVLTIFDFSGPGSSGGEGSGGVPEPSTAISVVLGLVALATIRRNAVGFERFENRGSRQ